MHIERKIALWNVNGLRAVHRKEALEPFLQETMPDILLLQETKLTEGAPLRLFLTEHKDYAQHYHYAQQKGYAGTALWVRQPVPQGAVVLRGMPGWDDREGRVIGLQYAYHGQPVTVLGVYFPNGGKSPEAWEEKLTFYEYFRHYLSTLRASGQRVLWGGDLNVAHTALDLARPKENDGKVGFHPLERAWADRLVADGWVDLWRAAHPEEVQYSWWSQRGGARERNVGWRIDSWWAHRDDWEALPRVTYLQSQQGSDHCPVLLECC
ncbi:exodeoxyribonuclease III [Candidatus Peribacteria bacterium]|nr:exodeoxyribonuclease III [Candidatus Peribacteria bacterium]